MTYRSRVYRQRNVQQANNEKAKDQDKFFSSNTEKGNGSKNAFFQAKANDPVGGSGDALEKEAETKAAQVNAADAVSEKKDEAVQRLATPEEDKQTSTNDERMKQDKDKQS